MFTDIITSQYIFIFVMTIGLLALIIELFVPSFGLIGLSGLYLILNAILAKSNFKHFYTYVAVSLLLAIVLGIVIIKALMARGIVSRFILDTQIVGNSKDEKRNKKELEILGKEGLVVKDLRPAGLIEIEGIEYDCLSYGEFIPKSSRIVVDKIEGNKVYCRRVK